jgi:hypothetical protein
MMLLLYPHLCTGCQRRFEVEIAGENWPASRHPLQVGLRRSGCRLRWDRRSAPISTNPQDAHSNVLQRVQCFRILQRLRCPPQRQRPILAQGDEDITVFVRRRGRRTRQMRLPQASLRIGRCSGKALAPVFGCTRLVWSQPSPSIISRAPRGHPTPANFGPVP